MAQAYNLVATLNLQSVDASQAIANLHKQLSATTFSINVTLNSANAIRQAGQLNQAMASASSSVKGSRLRDSQQALIGLFNRCQTLTTDGRIIQASSNVVDMP